MGLSRSASIGAFIVVLISGALIDVARGGDLVECEPQRVTDDGRHWAYRIIDGRECWYPGRPGKPKNELYWGRETVPSARQTVDQPEAETETVPSEPPSRLVVRRREDVEAAFAEIARARAEAVVLQAIFFARAIADLAIEYRLPSASVLRSYPHAGGLMSYGADIPHIFRRSAGVVHKILQGTKPADLPVEQPTKFALTINLRTAKALDLDVPPTLLARTDEI